MINESKEELSLAKFLNLLFFEKLYLGSQFLPYFCLIILKSKQQLKKIRLKKTSVQKHGLWQLEAKFFRLLKNKIYCT